MNARLAPMPDGAYVRPWPLHPQPLPGEVLSSWLARICELYPHIRPSDLLAELEIDCSVEDLDRYTPEPILVELAGRGAVPVERVRMMTLAGWTPWLLDSTDPADCDFDTYVHQFSILLPADLAREDRRRRTPTSEAWLPWASTPRSRACPACIDSLESTADMNMTLLHQYPVLSSCLDHPLSTRTLLCVAWSCNLLGSGPVRFGRTGLARSGSLSGHGPRSAQHRGSDNGMGGTRPRPGTCRSVVPASAHRRRRSVHATGSHRTVGDEARCDLEGRRSVSPAPDRVGSVRGPALGRAGESPRGRSDRNCDGRER